MVSQSQEIEKLHYQVDEFALSKDIPKGSSILVYGADRKGRCVYHWLKRENEHRVVGIVDREFYALREIEPDVQSPEWLFKTEYDYILIGVSSQDTADVIARWLEMRDVEKNKIIRAYYKDVK